MALDISSFLKRLRPLMTNPSASFTRPADTTTYAASDLVANSTTAGSVTPVALTVVSRTAGQVAIRRLVLMKSTTSATNAAFRLHVFRSAPTVANGDNGVLSMTGAANYLGNFVVGAMLGFTDGCVGFAVPAVGGEVGLKLASGTQIYCLVEALAAYGPGNAEVFTLSAEVTEL